MNRELTHFGIKGMRWGHRTGPRDFGLRAKESAYQKKIKNIIRTQGNSLPSSDKRILAYRNRSTFQRVGGTVAMTALKHVIMPAIMYKMRGEMPDFKALSKDIALDSAKSLAVQEALAYSVSRRYNQEGRRTSGNAKALMQPEEVANLAWSLRGVATTFAQGRLDQFRADRVKNEEIFNRWGSNILTSEASPEVIWRSVDDSVRISKK